jgi:hypothetical protein
MANRNTNACIAVNKEESIVVNQQVHACVIPKGVAPKYIAFVIKANAAFLETNATSTTIA